MPPGPNIDEMLKVAQVSWVVSAGGHALWACSTLTFHFDFSYCGDMSFWEKSCLSPDWQHLYECEISQFLSKELLTAHPSWGSDHVWCKSFPPNIDNQLGQDLAMKSWWSSHHKLLQEPKVDKFPLAQAVFVVQPVLQQAFCPRALLAHLMFSDSFKNT